MLLDAHLGGRGEGLIQLPESSEDENFKTSGAKDCPEGSSKPAFENEGCLGGSRFNMVDRSRKVAKFVFVCVEVLRPNQPNGVMSSTASLPNHTFTGQESCQVHLIFIMFNKMDICNSNAQRESETKRYYKSAIFLILNKSPAIIIE